MTFESWCLRQEHIVRLNVAALMFCLRRTRFGKDAIDQVARLSWPTVDVSGDTNDRTEKFWRDARANYLELNAVSDVRAEFNALFQ